MAADNGDKRPPMAVALDLASQVISISLMMALPAGAGYWLDLKFGTSPWLVVVGAVVGLAMGMVQLLRGVGRTGKKTENDIRNTDETQR